MKSLRFTLLPFACLGLLVLSARAQSVHWDPPGGVLPVSEVTQLELVFEDCTPEETPVPPKAAGFRMDFEGQSSNLSIINGSFSRKVTLTYAVLLSKQQPFEIPSFEVETNKGKVRVPAARFSPAGATVGSSGIALDEAAASIMTATPASVWAGEVFDLRYAIDVAEGYYPNWGQGTFEWDPSPLVAEDWSQPEPFENRDNGVRKGLSYHTRAIARLPGRIQLNPSSQLVNLSVGVSGFGFFQQRQYQQFAVTDKAPVIEVRPLPPAPQGFTGAVGNFRISSKIVPRDVKPGDPVTWTVELSGTGNWPEITALPAREVSRDFQAIQPKPKRTQSQGKLFEGTLSEDVVLIPTRAGSYELPEVNFTYFDPKTGAYSTLSAPGGTVTVAQGQPAGAPPAGPAITLSSAPQGPLPPAGLTAPVPEPPARGLGDPIAGTGLALEPADGETVALLSAAPWAAALALWGILAVLRARTTDPLRPRREARSRIEATLEALSGAPAAKRPELLARWQRDAAILLGVAHAAPHPGGLGDPAWSALWSEADRCLYGRTAELPADWIERARAAAQARRVKAQAPTAFLLPRNLLPFLALAAAFLTPRPVAADPLADYRRGDFKAAGNQWEAAAAQNPLDGSLRHNLSLALSQQDRWAEAAAQASAAFVQNPGDPAIERQVELACDKAGYVPEALEALVQPGPLGAFARIQSPGGWQRSEEAAALLAAAAFALLIGASYGFARSSWAVPAALIALGVALAAAVSSFIAYRAYGPLADARAVIVWRTGTLRSIPTEADVAQKTTPLPAGTVGLADKSFLGWIRLEFPDGGTGWVPSGEAVYLWRSPPR